MFGIDGFPGEKAVENKMWERAVALLPTKNVDAYTQGLMDLGATLCTRSKPLCGTCPMAARCIARASERVGELPTELVPHFFHSLAESLGAALHVSVTGENSHHMIEACFKGVGRALRQAFRRESDELPTTKGVL